MKKVLIPTKLDTAAADLLREKAYQVVQDAEHQLPELAAAHPDTEVLIVRSEKVTPEIMDALPELKLIVRAGAGYNTIDIKYARRKNIAVMNTPGANSNAVAEEVVALMLAAARHLVPADISTRAGKWEKKRFMGTELTGKTIGIVGLGNIGRLLIKRLEGFEMRILGYDPLISPGLAEKLGVELCSLQTIFEKSDYVSLHIPENDDTRGIINYRLLSLMKPGATLVNCARAGILNENDLRLAKTEKKLFFCNDVYPKDEAGEKTVADLADVMLPHLGASTEEANFNAAIRAAEQTVAYFEQGITNCVVNKGIPDGLDEAYQRLAFVLTSIARGYLGRDQHPTRIETSFYGELNQYAKWMTPPIAAAISSEFDIFQDTADAESFLASRGIELLNRDVDDEKHYGESMTIDLFAGDEQVSQASVRGTITENNLMVSRLKNFDKLYLEPTGHNLFVEYRDQPGIIGKIASVLGEKNINIIDLRAPQDLKIGNSLAVIKTNIEIPAMLIDKIKEDVNAEHAFQFSFET
ncbi:MAG: 3-phosphoglycerate dehydrogenase family protein [Victivallaceae bacterium]|nr:3-phosphoglycerate dehydrogenase family protein [Victivallaceae bacterium]